MFLIQQIQFQRMRKLLMDEIIFYKYTSNGNNFIIIDEIDRTIIPESGKSIFSKQIANNATGIGCDSVIFIENKNNLLIMRIFENGFESNMCGNGLICVAQHLYRQYQITEATIATEIFSGNPVLRNINRLDDQYYQAVLGKATLVPEKFFNKENLSYATHLTHQILYHIPLHSFVVEECYLTFTGEPHIVIFSAKQINHDEHVIFDQIFSPNIQSDLINKIGAQFNQMTNHFPHGINVNVVKMLANNKIAYRCYERGINNETYACGTGAAAVASIAHALSLTNNNLSVLPWRARHEPLYHDAEIIVSAERGRYTLTSKSIFLARGMYLYNRNIFAKAA